MRDKMIDEALRRAPEVLVPQHFANRVLANLPPSAPEKLEPRWVRPALALAGATTLGSLAWVSLTLGLGRWLAQPNVLLSVLGVEAAVTLAWAWRQFHSAR